jgi:uracil permease
MFISNSGAFVAPVLAALAAGGYTAVAVGGLTACLTYCIFGIIFKYIPVNSLYKVMPKALIGSITIVIGINLMGFISGYIGDTGNLGVCIALITVLAIALSNHYLKGIWSMFPLLIGTLVGYLVAIPFGLVDFTKFQGIHLFTIPDFAFTHFSSVSFKTLVPIIIMYLAFTVSAICECLADHKSLGNIIGKDLYIEPGLSRIFIGEGVANIATSCLGGLGGCSYGESLAMVGFSKCAATRVTFGAAILMILLGFFEPIQAFIASIPGCVIGGGTPAYVEHHSGASIWHLVPEGCTCHLSVQIEQHSSSASAHRMATSYETTARVDRLLAAEGITTTLDSSDLIARLA